VARNTFFKASAEWSTSDAAVSERQQPVEGTPKGRTRLLAVCSTPWYLEVNDAIGNAKFRGRSHDAVI
jgi:hypothetical protein